MIGRLPECAVVLNDPNVSRRHAEVRRAGDDVVRRRPRSTNGTGQRRPGSEQVPGRAGTRSRVGHHTLRLRDVRDAGPAAFSPVSLHKSTTILRPLQSSSSLLVLALLPAGRPGRLGGGGPATPRESRRARRRPDTALRADRRGRSGATVPSAGDRPRGRPGQVYDLADEITVGRRRLRCADDRRRLHLQPPRPALPRERPLWVEDLGSTNGTWVNSEKIAGPPASARAICSRWAGPCSRWPVIDRSCARDRPPTSAGSGRSTRTCALETPNLFAVADGMGGHAGGEVAARLAVDTLLDVVRASRRSTAFSGVLRGQHRRLAAEPGAERASAGMGTTTHGPGPGGRTEAGT